MKKLIFGISIAASLFATSSANAMIWVCVDRWWSTECRWVCDPIIYDEQGVCR